MNAIGFFRELGVGVFLALLSALLLKIARTFIGVDAGLNLVVGLCVFIYSIFLCRQSSLASGKLSLLLFIGSGLLLSSILINSFLIFLSISIVFVWIARNALFFTGVFAMIADLAVLVASTLVAIWGYMETHSLLVSIWCFFMLLASGWCLFSSFFDPRDKHPAGDNNSSSSRRFQRACRSAELALKRVASN